MKILAVAALLLIAYSVKVSALCDSDDETQCYKWHSHHENTTYVEAQFFAEPVNNIRNLPNYYPGRMTYIYGQAPHFGSFDIDLIPVYDTPSTEICLRITVDLDTYHIRRSSYVHDEWLEIEDDGYAGILPRRFFYIGILAQCYGYEIIIGDYHFATYYHRIPFIKEMKVSVSPHVWLDPIEYY